MIAKMLFTYSLLRTLSQRPSLDLSRVETFSIEDSSVHISGLGTSVNGEINEGNI